MNGEWSVSINQKLRRCYNHEMVEIKPEPASTHRKLVFYSDQSVSVTTEIDSIMLSLLGKTNPRIAYIPSGGNSTDLFYQAQMEYYSQYQIDLSPCFYLGDSYQPELLDSLLSADAIHLSGGNTFHFLYWLRKRNLISPLKQYAENGGVLIGVSAGAILMTPDIHTSLLYGDSLPFENFNTQSLGLVDFAFVPHLGSHANLEDIKAYSRQNSQLSVVACPDNGAVVVVDDEIRYIGDVRIYKNGTLINPR